MKTALVIAPGRGTYGKGELGYLKRHHADRAELLAGFDAVRREAGAETVTALDRRPTYSLALHTRGDAASPLIYACSIADFLAIDRTQIEIVAATGNSMGWYTALACAGALDPDRAFRMVDTMGRLMQQALIGGQLVHTTLDEVWRPIPGRRAALLEAMHAADPEGRDLFVSIELGGMIVFAGTEAALGRFEASTPAGPGRFPMRLQNHAAFHTPLQAPVAARGFAALADMPVEQPEIPLIDGQGSIWRPHATDPALLRDYTLGAQVTQTYDFTRAIQVALREFAPDLAIVLGPGDTLGGAVAQAMLGIGWKGLANKDDFARLQQDDPYLVSMARPEQRSIVAALEARPS